MIGGFVRDDHGLPGIRQPRDLALYSAGGPKTGPLPPPHAREDLSAPSCLDAPPDGPDASAPSDRSRVLSGMPATGTRSNSTIALNGTSVALPLVARWVADNLSGDLPSREDVQAAACGGAGRIG